MNSPAEILADFQQWWWVYLSMPLVAALIGWSTKLVALEMMFKPLSFKGFHLGRIPIGWQGMIPRQAPKMAAIAYDMISTHLIQPQEIFDRIDPKELVKAVRKPLEEAVDDVARELAQKYYPGLWEALPAVVQNMVIGQLKREAPKYAEELVREVQTKVTDVLDLRQMVIDNLTRDRALLNKMIRDVGGPDLKKVPVMGFWFGGLIGVMMAVMWALFHNPWILPIMGFLNGWITDYVALQMLFQPHEPKRYFGVFKWHGLFAKRRAEVIPQYGKLIATEILTPDKIVEALLRGPSTDKLFQLAAKHISRAADAVPSLAKPIVPITVGTSQWIEMKQVAAEKAFAHAEAGARAAHGYALEAMDIENTVVERMMKLSPEQYENLLRPAVKEDEPLAIAVGAILGFVVGELQAIATVRIVMGEWSGVVGWFL